MCQFFGGGFSCSEGQISASIRQATNGNTQVWRCSVVLGVHSCVSRELSGNLTLILLNGRVEYDAHSPQGRSQLAGR